LKGRWGRPPSRSKMGHLDPPTPARARRVTLPPEVRQPTKHGKSADSCQIGQCGSHVLNHFGSAARSDGGSRVVTRAIVAVAVTAQLLYSAAHVDRPTS